MNKYEVKETNVRRRMMIEVQTFNDKDERGNPRTRLGFLDGSGGVCYLPEGTQHKSFIEVHLFRSKDERGEVYNWPGVFNSAGGLQQLPHFTPLLVVYETTPVRSADVHGVVSHVHRFCIDDDLGCTLEGIRVDYSRGEQQTAGKTLSQVLQEGDDPARSGREQQTAGHTAESGRKR
jgi:hypothetical protein